MESRESHLFIANAAPAMMTAAGPSSRGGSEANLEGCAWSTSKRFDLPTYIKRMGRATFSAQSGDRKFCQFIFNSFSRGVLVVSPWRLRRTSLGLSTVAQRLWLPPVQLLPVPQVAALARGVQMCLTREFVADFVLLSNSARLADNGDYRRSSVLLTRCCRSAATRRRHSAPSASLRPACPAAAPSPCRGPASVMKSA